MPNNQHKPNVSRSGLTIAFAAAVAVFALAVAACGGSDETSPDGGGATKTAVPATPSGGDNQDLKSKLKDFTSEWGKATARVSYTSSSLSPGETPNNTNWTIIQKPPNSRFEFGTGADASIFIETAAKAYICSAGQCLSSPRTDRSSSGLGFLAALSNPDKIQSDIADATSNLSIDTFDDTIAGQDAKCFHAKGKFETGTATTKENGEATWCFSDRGLLLLASFSSASGQFSLKASEVGSDVPDSAFDPPYPVTELPTYPSGAP